MRQRNKTIGVVTVTAQELRAKANTSGLGGNSGSAYGASIITQTFEVSDFVVDGSLFKLTWNHSLSSNKYIWQIFETDDSSEGLVEKVFRGDNELTLWFTTNTKNYTALITY